jgi:hypothetical protein
MAPFSTFHSIYHHEQHHEQSCGVQIVHKKFHVSNNNFYLESKQKHIKNLFFYLRQHHSWDTELVTLPSKGELLLELFLFLFKFFIIFSQWFSCASLLGMLTIRKPSPFSSPVQWIRYILVRIRIRRSVPLTESGSRPSRYTKNIFFPLSFLLISF